MTNSERREYNVQRTIGAALECFQELGIEATTQVVLAKKVCLTTKTMQRYFKSKEEMVLLAMKQLNDRYYDLIQWQLEKADFSSMSGLDVLLAFFAAHEVFFDPQNRILLLMTEMHLYLIRHHILESQILMQINPVSPERRYVMKSLEKGVQDGSIRGDIDLDLTYAYLTSSFAGMIQRMMILPSMYDGSRNGIDKKDILAYYIEKTKATLQP